MPKYLAEISEAEWEKTPVSVKRVVGQLLERIAALEERQAHLEEQIKRNSKNSSQPPSQDSQPGFKPKPKEPGKRSRGAQAGHEGHQQKLYAAEECALIEEHYPSHCCGCGEVLSGWDNEPQRCQIVEIPPLSPIVVEHRFHALDCPRCGMRTRAYEAEVVDGSRYGDRLCALVGLLSGEYRQSHRMVVRLLSEIFEVELSVGSVGRLRQAVSEAVAVPVAQAHEYVQQQRQVNIDETRFAQGNADKANPKGTQGWLWVVVTPLVCMILGYHGYIASLAELRQACGISRDGSKASQLLNAARSYKLAAQGFKADIPALQQLEPPFIVFYNFNHFLVVEGFYRDRVYLNDPATGHRSVSLTEFSESFAGVVLTFAPEPEFQPGGEKPNIMRSLWARLRSSKWSLVFCIVIGFLLVLPGLATPAFSQIFIDQILLENRQDWLRPLIIAMIITAVLTGLLTRMQLQVLRQLKVKLAIAMSSRFLRHLLYLPVSFYDQRFAGEISNRTQLNDRLADLNTMMSPRCGA